MVMKRLMRAILFLVLLPVSSYAQSDWHTYPARTIANIIEEHSGEVSNKSDLIVSADPFPFARTVLRQRRISTDWIW